MRLSRLFVITIAALLVGACNTTSSVELRAADEARCHSYGFRQGTEAFAKCLLQLDLDRAADRRSRYDYPYSYPGRGWYWGRPW